MIYPFDIGDTVWHGARYWKQDDLEKNEVAGWNVHYMPYVVTRITAKRIEVINHSIGEIFYLNRQTMERDGRQYHSRVHEYFFAQKPDHVGDYPPMNDRTVLKIETKQ